MNGEPITHPLLGVVKGLVVLIGDNGVGKSKLLRELAPPGMPRRRLINAGPRPGELAAWYGPRRLQPGWDTWDGVVANVCLGLGFQHTRDVLVRGADVVIDDDRGVRPPSTGEERWLAYVAMQEQIEGLSLLAIDDPEQHLDLNAIFRLVDLLEGVAETIPVVVATHSDRFLDCLTDASSVRQLDFNERNELRVQRVDAKAWSEWAADYSGVGHLRSEGYLSYVLEACSHGERGGCNQCDSERVWRP